MGRRITADFGPYQIRTFVVPRDHSLAVVETDLVERTLAEQAGFEASAIDAVPGFAAGPLTMTRPS